MAYCISKQSELPEVACNILPNMNPPDYLYVILYSNQFFTKFQSYWSSGSTSGSLHLQVSLPGIFFIQAFIGLAHSHHSNIFDYLCKENYTLLSPSKILYYLVPLPRKSCVVCFHFYSFAFWFLCFAIRIRSFTEKILNT